LLQPEARLKGFHFNVFNGCFMAVNTQQIGQLEKSPRKTGIGWANRSQALRR
jgi:hypothetical protein